MNSFQVSVIMPALNEESNLAIAFDNVREGFRSMGIDGEVVVVNDGSSDATGSIAEGLRERHPFVHVVHHDSPQGVGAAFRDGVRAAHGDIVLMLPGDGENDAVEIFQYLPLLAQVDMVVPFIFNREVRSFKRRLLSNIFTRLINLSFATSLNHTNGTVMYRRCLLEGMTQKSDGFFYQTELLIKLIKRGYLYAEVPYALRGRVGGQSKAFSLKSLCNVARAYLGLMSDNFFTPKAEAALHPASVTAKRRR